MINYMRHITSGYNLRKSNREYRGQQICLRVDTFFLIEQTFSFYTLNNQNFYVFSFKIKHFSYQIFIKKKDIAYKR